MELNIKHLIQKYESLSHHQQIWLLKEKSKEITEKSSPEILTDYYILYAITLGDCTTLAQIKEIEELTLRSDNKVEVTMNHAESYISSAESDKILNVSERATLIKWIEDRAVEKTYWIKGFGENFESEYSRAMVACRSSLIKPMFTYSPEQLEALRKVNELFIEAGTQLFYKMKGFREKMEIWNEEMSDKQTIQHMEDAFLRHEGTPYEYWLSKQLEGGINGLLWGDKGDASKPEGFVYQEPEENEGFPGWDKKKNPEYWKHWDEGFDREKVKDIPICYLYHDLWDHQTLGYNVMDIICMKEVKIDAGVCFEYTEEDEVWND